MLAYSQILVVAAVTIGLVLFIFVNYFVVRRLQLDERRSRMNIEQPNAVSMEEVTPQRSPEEIERERELALFYMHQEQVRRLVDAKIDIIKDSAETNNKIALIQAEVAKINAEKEVRMIESGMSPAQPQMLSLAHGGVVDVDEDSDGSMIAMEAETPKGGTKWGRHADDEDDSLTGDLSKQQRSVRYESERQLAELEEQMHGLPGRSMSGWVRAQQESNRD